MAFSISCLCLVKSSVSPMTFSVAATTRPATALRLDLLARGFEEPLGLVLGLLLQLLAELLRRLAGGVDDALSRLSRINQLCVGFFERGLRRGAGSLGVLQLLD